MTDEPIRLGPTVVWCEKHSCPKGVRACLMCDVEVMDATLSVIDSAIAGGEVGPYDVDADPIGVGARVEAFIAASKLGKRNYNLWLRAQRAEEALEPLHARAMKAETELRNMTEANEKNSAELHMANEILAVTERANKAMRERLAKIDDEEFHKGLL